MKKTEQQQINDKIGECLEDLSESMEMFAKNRDLMMRLIEFGDTRIDSLENKIDILMTERTEEVELPKYYDEPETMTWHEVMEKYENHSVYRLMTKEELKKHYEDETLEDLSGSYWSSSENSNNYAWFVYFDNGYLGEVNKDSSIRVRVVNKEMVDCKVDGNPNVVKVRRKDCSMKVELGFEEMYQDVDYGEPGYIYYSHEIKGVGFYSVDTDSEDFHVKLDNSDYEVRSLRKLGDLILSLREL